MSIHSVVGKALLSLVCFLKPPLPPLLGRSIS
jgi:hypothetical protein